MLCSVIMHRKRESSYFDAMTQWLGIAGAASYWYLGDGSVDIAAGITISSIAALMSFVGAKHSQRLQSKHLKRTLGYFMAVSALLIGARSFFPRSNDATTPLDATTAADAASAGGAIEAVLSEPVLLQATDSVNHSSHSFQVPHWAMELWHAHTWQEMSLLGVAGAVTGYVSGLLGVGGGITLLPILSIGTYEFLVVVVVVVVERRH